MPVGKWQDSIVHTLLIGLTTFTALIGLLPNKGYISCIFKDALCVALVVPKERVFCMYQCEH